MMLPQVLLFHGTMMPLWSCPYGGRDVSTGTILLYGHGVSTSALTYFLQFPHHLSTHNLHSIPSLLPSPVFSVMKKACLVYHRALSSQTDSYWTLNRTSASIWITIKWPSATDRSPPTQGCAMEIPGLACGWGSVSESHSCSFQTLAFFPGTRPAGCEQL